MTCSTTPRLATALLIALAATPGVAHGASTEAPVRYAAPSAHATGPSIEYGLDVTAGALSELRLQLFPGSLGSARIGVEAMFGTSAPYFGKEIGLGCRFEWRPAAAERDALLISPGVDLYVVFGEGAPPQGGSVSSGNWFAGGLFRGPQDSIALISPGLDIGWRHAFSPAFAMVLGARGAGIVSFGGRDSNGNETRGKVNAVGGLFAGTRF